MRSATRAGASLAIALSFALPAAAEQDPAAPAGIITLADAITRAMQANPEVAGAEFAVRAREAAILQARRRINPQLVAEVENLGGDRAATGGRQSTVSLEQAFEFGGKRAARVGVAEASRDLSQLALESRRLGVVANVARNFLEVLGAQRRLELGEQSVEVAREVAGVVSERVGAGKVSPNDETRASLALAAETLERDRAESELASARLRLAATWGATAPDFARASGDLDSLPELPVLDSLQELVETTPELKRWTAELAHRKAVVELERARAAPDVSVSGGYRMFEADTEAFVVGISIPLPLADRNHGARQAARQELLQAEQERQAALVRVHQAVAENHVALMRAEREVRKIRDEMIPDAESAFSAVNEGYSLGKFGYVEVLDARRVLTAVRTQLLRAVVDVQRASAELQRLTGTVMNDITNGSERDEN